MARWQDLCRLLLDEKLTARDIVVALGVKPSRLRRMLRSKHMAAHLAVVESVADKKAGHTVVAGIGPAAQSLTDLTDLAESQRPETTRRACLDVLTKAKEIYHGQR